MDEIERRVKEVIDPTANVQKLLADSVIRQDDLREAYGRLFEAEIRAEGRRIDEQMKLRADYSQQLENAESKRIDAIRAVDVAAVAVASERATQSASVLANQVAQSAETLRTLVASTAVTIAQQLAQLSNQLSDRISALERSSYEDIGKGRVADPMMTEMVTELKALRELSTLGTGKDTGLRSMWGYIVGAAGILLGLISLINYLRP